MSLNEVWLSNKHPRAHFRTLACRANAPASHEETAACTASGFATCSSARQRSSIAVNLWMSGKRVECGKRPAIHIFLKGVGCSFRERGGPKLDLLSKSSSDYNSASLNACVRLERARLSERPCGGLLIGMLYRVLRRIQYPAEGFEKKSSRGKIRLTGLSQCSALELNMNGTSIQQFTGAFNIGSFRGLP
jgi:hypothetical protein